MGGRTRRRERVLVVGVGDAAQMQVLQDDVLPAVRTGQNQGGHRPQPQAQGTGCDAPAVRQQDRRVAVHRGVLCGRGGGVVCGQHQAHPAGRCAAGQIVEHDDAGGSGHGEHRVAGRVTPAVSAAHHDDHVSVIEHQGSGTSRSGVGGAQQ